MLLAFLTALPAAMQDNLFRLNEQLLQPASAIQDLRMADTAAITGTAVARSRKTAGYGMLFIVLGLIIGTSVSLLTWRKFVREYTTYQAILSNTRNVVMTINYNGLITSFNRVAEQIFEIDRSLVLGRHFADVFTGEKTAATVKFTLFVDEVLTGGRGRCNQEVYYTASDGWEMVLNVDCLPLTDKKPTGLLLIAREITERKVMEEKLSGLTLRDGLTGLYNHSFLQKTLYQELKKSNAQGRPLAFVLLNIDNFKFYNDSFGHPTRDELLKQFARVLLDNTRSSDIVGRYGGDEFGIILPDTGYKLAEQIGERLRRQIAEYPFPNREALPGGCLTASIGIALFPHHTSDAGELIRLADEAMYHAKRNAKNQVQLYFSAIKEFQKELHSSDARLLTSFNTISTMINAKDPYTYAHSEKVAEYASILA